MQRSRVSNNQPFRLMLTGIFLPYLYLLHRQRHSQKMPNCNTYHTNVMLEETYHYKDLDMRRLTQLIRVELVMGVQCRFGPCGNSWLWRYLCLYHCLMSHALQAKNADAKRGSKKGREIMKQGNSRQKSPAILHLR